MITFIAASRLPFQLVEHPEFRALLEIARLAPCFPEIPTATTVRRHLQEIVEERQYALLQKLPDGAKLSIALDCWTSPFRQAFMAITGYFIDQEWNYRELLLGFEPLYGSHTGAYLSTVLLDILEKHQITERVLTITTDNASNNGTLLGSLQEAIDSLELPRSVPVIRIPCIAHVIQLSLKELLGQMDANPRNEREEIEWTERGHIARQENRTIVDTLNKVSIYLISFSYLSFFTNLYYLLGSEGSSLHQQKSSAPRELYKASDERAKAYAYTRCSDTVEFNVPYAPAC